ncbi:fluoride efflux transporter CrcB [Rodentibacter haemolyticus]|uniref:Fluoride-specific ion channel FluC n=1 Tax=Rodentibacter haemolyticus TaxID=2778911 RepID=A0ABX6V027_9PAST|nr:fluoride efflux transporter CrcB [Rodentibacter haemolyticus]QPB43618.1 fluoride efflux transporter CrcB [Rodentibacter haemolyticus]
MLQSLLCVGSGAVLGALGRWGLSQWLNSLFSTIAFGTLLANLTGCFLMGVFITIFWQYPQINPLWKLFIVTGFLGSFTTFSSFSGEVIEQLISDKWFNGIAVISTHLLGGLICTALGILLCKLLIKF